jgi:hypothetical protein
MLNDRYRNDKKAIIHMNNAQKNAKSEVERKISTNIYTFESVTICPICEQSNYEQLAEKDRYGLYCSTVICKNCGLLITNPVMTQASLNKFYLDDYRELYTGHKTVQYDFFEGQYKHGKEIISFIRTHKYNILLQNLFVLEIGCGAGGILSAFKDEGAEILGLDLGTDYMDYGIKKHNLHLQKGSIEDYKGEKKPDIIIYSHVLEHTRLTSEMISITKLCHEKTLIYIEVPGVLSIQKTYHDFLLYLQNAHLFHFSLGTLRNLFAKYGFSLLYGNEFVKSIFILDNKKEKRISNFYEIIISYLINTEKNRKKNYMKWKLYNILIFFLKKVHLFNILKYIIHKRNVK